MNQPPRKLVKSNSAAELTPEQIYDIVMGKDKGGIQGYRCPRHYYDYHEVMWLRKREQILKKHKQHGLQKIGNQTKKQEEKSLQKNSISLMSK